MNFRDIGIIIAKRPLKENSSIILLFTGSHGLYAGVVRDSAKKGGNANQPGNLVDFFWQGRLHEHIGSAKCEVIKSYSGSLITDKLKLYAFNSIVSLIKIAFHEREPHNNFFPILKNYLDKLVKGFNFEEYIKLELNILEEAGYGLDFNACVVTGERENLLYVSPKSGKAVSADAGLPYAEKLLHLPQFLINPADEIQFLDKKQAFDLTSYFFNRYFSPKDLDLAPRRIFMEYAANLIPA